MDTLTNLLGRQGYLPHGYCFLWSPGLLSSMVGANTAIALSYFSIATTVLAYVRRRPGVNFGGAAFMFSAFIFACGITHVLGVWTIWRPDYGLQAAIEVGTALVSAFTAIALWRLLPAALRIPSGEELKAAVLALRAEVARRKTAEDHLLELEQSLAAALASIDAASITTDASGRVTRMNAVAERITGWSSADATGVLLWAVFDREDRPPAWLNRNPVDVLRDSGKSATALQPRVCISHAGLRTAVEISAELTRNAEGTVRGMAIVFRDMSRLKGAEADVRRLAAVVESSSDAIIAKTLQGRITNWNAAAEQMFGYTAAEAVGQSVTMLIPPEREVEEMQILSDLEKGHTLPPFRTVRLCKDGRRLEASVQISPIRDELGRIIGAAKSARDLTHQRHIEAALRRSQAQLRFALESASIGDWELDPQSDRIQGSVGYANCFGSDASLLQQTWQALLACAHPDDSALAAASMRDAIAGLRPFHAEFRVHWGDASMHWVRMDGKLMHDENGVEKLVGIVADVTAMRSAEQAREQALELEAENQRVRETSRMKSLFLANMSHELRTPLNAVIGFADLLRMGTVEPHSVKHGEYLGHIAKAGRHLLQVINDVLDLAKVEAGGLDFNPAPIEPQTLIDEVVATLGVQAAIRQVEIVSAVTPDVHALELDPLRLKQVLFNYLSNAIKFSEPGGLIQVRALGEGPLMWRLEVEDAGIGIAAHELPRLFVEFQQLESGHARRHQGTGLGLALTRNLVEAQSGRVGVYSTPGKGSVFYAVLPRRIDASAPDDLPRLLVAAHDHAQRDGLARQLAAAGISADTAGTAADVVRLVRTRRYDAMTIDLSMPDTQGLHVLANLRLSAGTAGAEIKAFGMTATGGDAVSFPVSDLIAKPLQTDELRRAMAPLRGLFDRGRPVLVVDDDPVARELMQASLQAIGIGSSAVASGAEALKALATLKPAALVLDLLMPGMPGLRVLHALRRDPAWRDLPVFIWTSLALSVEEREGLSRAAQTIVDEGAPADGLVLDAIVRWAGTFRPTVASAAMP